MTRPAALLLAAATLALALGGCKVLRAIGGPDFHDGVGGPPMTAAAPPVEVDNPFWPPRWAGLGS